MMAAAEAKLAERILQRALAHAGRNLDEFDCEIVWTGAEPRFVVTRKPPPDLPASRLPPGVTLRSVARMLRRRPSRRPRLPRRCRTRARLARRHELRRNRRATRTFIHAAPIAPAIREPRVRIPPWLFG